MRYVVLAALAASAASVGCGQDNDHILARSAATFDETPLTEDSERELERLSFEEFADFFGLSYGLAVEARPVAAGSEVALFALDLASTLAEEARAFDWTPDWRVEAYDLSRWLDEIPEYQWLGGENQDADERGYYAIPVKEFPAEEPFADAVQGDFYEQYRTCRGDDRLACGRGWRGPTWREVELVAYSGPFDPVYSVREIDSADDEALAAAFPSLEGFTEPRAWDMEDDEEEAREPPVGMREELLRVIGESAAGRGFSVRLDDGCGHREQKLAFVDDEQGVAVVISRPTYGPHSSCLCDNGG